MLLHDDHYYVIKNLKGFLECSYVCESFFTGYKQLVRATRAPTIVRFDAIQIVDSNFQTCCTTRMVTECAIHHTDTKNIANQERQNLAYVKHQIHLPKQKMHMYCTKVQYLGCTCATSRPQRRLPLCYIQCEPLEEEHSQKYVFYDFERFVDKRVIIFLSLSPF